MLKYKTVGILGGMGPEATVSLYLRIIQIFQQKYGAKYDSEFPEILIINLPIPDVVENPKEESKIKEMLIDGVKRLEKAGADFVAIPCNTVTYYISDMQKSVKIPILNILQETTDEVRKNNLKRIGLLGTEMTIKSNIYQNVLKDVEIVILNDDEQKGTTKVIMNILSGKKRQEDRELLNNYIKKLKKLGAEKVILGCTELPLIIKNDEGVLDTLQILAKATVRETNPRKLLE